MPASGSSLRLHLQEGKGIPVNADLPTLRPRVAREDEKLAFKNKSKAELQILAVKELKRAATPTP